MKRRRFIRKLLAAAAVGLIAAGVVSYLAVKHVPGDYRPLALAVAQRRQARRCVEQAVVEVFGAASRVGSLDPHCDPADQPRQATVEFGGDTLNRWIASLPPEATTALYRAGLRDPAIAVGDGQITLYAHWARYDAVVGVDLVPVFDDTQRMTIRIAGARLGRLPLPRQVIDEHRREVIDLLVEYIEQWRQTHPSGAAATDADDLAGATERVVEALRGVPVRLDLPRQYGHARIKGIRPKRGKLVIEIISLLPEPPAADQPSRPSW
ncbi:MAG: hypothetical protein ACOC95_04200 [Planctomycetota bacterium]